MTENYSGKEEKSFFADSANLNFNNNYNSPTPEQEFSS